jgi:hypothetical protein
MTTDKNMVMFGELEDAPNDDERMVVRALGYVLGTSDGWFHYRGLAVIFAVFQTQHAKLVPLVANIPPEKTCLGIDFYTGEVKIIEGGPSDEPKVHHSLQLQDLFNP